VLDVFESAGTEGSFGANFGTPNDDADDADGIADYIDFDSDDDGTPDALESGLTFLPADVTYLDADGTIDLDPATAAGLTNTDSDATELDFRSLQDTDGDGVADHIDIDDDNDGILDVVEDGPGSQTETVVLFDFNEANAIAGDADQGFTSFFLRNGSQRNELLTHSVTGVNGNGENNTRRFEVADNLPDGFSAEQADFTQTFSTPTITVNGIADGTFTIDAPTGVDSLDGNGFIGGFDTRPGQTFLRSPNLTATERTAFELGRYFQFDHLNFSADVRDNQNNFFTPGVTVSFFHTDGTQVSATIAPDFNLTASGQFQTPGCSNKPSAF